ncbi:hypothetical protein BDQ17DRAFT_1336616 [Cyathus striatus]|nr:hypothetical protein BDQ17DRAFT_1336616 [Cyathus striatus]
MFDIIVEGLPQSCPKHTASGYRAAIYTLHIKIDGKTMLTYDFTTKKEPKNLPKTNASEGNDAKYILERTFGCLISKTSKVNIEVNCKHSSLYEPHEICTSEIEDFGSKLQLNTALEYGLKKKQRTATLVLKVSRVSTAAELAQFRLMNIPSKCLYTVADLEGLGIISQILKSEEGLSCPEWINFLGSMGNLLKIAIPIGKVDQHAKLALFAAKVAFELFMRQKTRDERVLGLIRVMANLYQMILDSHPLEKCQTLIYENRQFWWVFIVIQLEQVMITFFALKEVFFTGIMISIGNLNVRIMEKLEELSKQLDELVNDFSLPVVGKSWSELYGCLEGTHDHLLSKIYGWVTASENEVPKAFILLGPSQCGKSAIAHTVASFFHKQGLLGATIFFDSSNSNSSKNVLLSIIRELSKYDSAIYENIKKGLMRNPKIKNDGLLQQFKFLNGLEGTTSATEKISTKYPTSDNISTSQQYHWRLS